MVTIHFTCEDDKEMLEKGHRIIVLNGTVKITPHQWTYEVPNWVLGLLDKEQVPYEKVVNHDGIKHNHT